MLEFGMRRKYSWEDFGREEEARLKERRGRDDAMTHAISEGRRLGKIQREEVSKYIVRPFLIAMGQAGNPGAGWRGIWTDGEPKKTRMYSHASAPRGYYDVYTSGKWLFGNTAGSVGAGRGRHIVSAWKFSSEFAQDEKSTLPDEELVQFQGWLVNILRAYEIPLPRDN
jgi:hypothetical protein